MGETKFGQLIVNTLQQEFGSEDDNIAEKTIFRGCTLPCPPCLPLFLVLSQPKCKKPTLVSSAPAFSSPTILAQNRVGHTLSI